MIDRGILNRSLSVMVCDDIRQEIGEKVSLIGCYGTIMWVNEFPAALPKLCMLALFKTPVARCVSNLVVRVRKGEEIIGEQTYENLPSLEAAPEWATGQVFNSLFVFSPFQIENPCTLFFEADADGEKINGGSFQIDPFPKQAQ